MHDGDGAGPEPAAGARAVRGAVTAEPWAAADGGPKVSVVTAVAPDRDDHVAEAAASIRYARTKIALQWVVVWDGGAQGALPGADVVLEGRAGSGVACTRNVALAALAAPYVTVLDADDMLVVDGLLAACAAFDADPELGWVGLSRKFPDGSATKHTFADSCDFSPGELAQAWQAPLMFHPNSVVLRTEVLQAVGGWPAVASNEDLGMILCASELAAGRKIPATLTQYRVWDKQEVGKASYVRSKQQAFAYIEVSLNALRARCGRAAVAAPANPGGAFGTMQVGS